MWLNAWDSKLALYLRRLVRSMAFRATAYSVLAVVAALVSGLLTPIIPTGLSTEIGADSLDHILSIIASSMLTVTTFSLGIAVSAYNSAASGATPRATRLLVEDATTHNALSTFVGAFLFSLVGIVVLRTGYYGEQGRVVLFFVTIGVIVVIVASLLRWIGHLTEIGRMDDTLGRVERAASAAIDQRLAVPYLGCNPLPDGYRLPRGNHPVFARNIGYVQHIDVSALDELAQEWGVQFAISALPGTFADPNRELLLSDKELNTDQILRVRAVFTIGDDRSFEQDPRFGFIVLAEIASRALSPAVNDPGTAIAVLGRLVRLLHRWNEGASAMEPPDVVYKQVYVPGLKLSDLFDDAFTSISRDAAGIVEVNVRLQKALTTLAMSGNVESREQALRHSALSLARAKVGLQLSDDLKIVEALRDQLRDDTS